MSRMAKDCPNEKHSLSRRRKKSCRCERPAEAVISSANDPRLDESAIRKITPAHELRRGVAKVGQSRITFVWT